MMHISGVRLLFVHKSSYTAYEEDLPVMHPAPCCTSRNCPSRHLQSSHPRFAPFVTIMYPGMQKQSSGDSASASASVMPPPWQRAHCTYSSARHPLLLLLLSAVDVKNSLDGAVSGSRTAAAVGTLPTNSTSLYRVALAE